jgi:hypothetical protein
MFLSDEVNFLGVTIASLIHETGSSHGIYVDSIMEGYNSMKLKVHKIDLGVSEVQLHKMVVLNQAI